MTAEDSINNGGVKIIQQQENTLPWKQQQQESPSSAAAAVVVNPNPPNSPYQQTTSHHHHHIPIKQTEDKEENEREQEQLEEFSETCFICLDSILSSHTGDKDLATALPCKNIRCRQKRVHAKCIYEWRQTNRRTNSQQNRSNVNSTQNQRTEEIKVLPASCPLCRGELEHFSYFPPDLINSKQFSDLDRRRKFLTTPVSPEAGFVRCFIKLNHLSKNDDNTGSKIMSYESKNHPGAKIDVGVYELFLQAPTTLKYPLGPVPDQFSPREGDRQLAFGTRTRYPKSGVKRGPAFDKVTKAELYTTVSQIDLYMTNAQYEPSIAAMAENYVATVKSSFSGFKHEVLVPLEMPKFSANGMQQPVDYDETCCVHFIQNRSCVKNTSAPGPRKIQVCLPKVRHQDANPEGDKRPPERAHRTEEQEACITPLETVKRIPSTLSHALTYKSLNMPYEGVLPGEFTFGRNKEPYWLESIEAYSLDFKGRVTMPSNKNFQLIVELDEEQKQSEQLRLASEHVVPELMRDKLSAKGENDQDDIALQFGKVGEDSTSEIFSMDFKWPLTPLQAFGICLGACDRNLTVV